MCYIMCTCEVGPIFRGRNSNREVRNQLESVKRRNIHKRLSTSCLLPSSRHVKCFLQALSQEDIEELARDARLLKKFKSGKISEDELDRQL